METVLSRLKSSIFGASRNDRFAELLKELSALGLKCHAHFARTDAQDVQGIIDFEHQADRIVGDIHELLDNAFILRFDIPDSMKLTDELDDVIDGMRKVVLHVDAYRKYLSKLPPSAHELIALSGEMMVEVDRLIAMLQAPRLPLADVRAASDKIGDMESKADRLVAANERDLVEQYSKPGANVLEFIAWHQLFHLLEQITDDANHCASQILSLARKEA